MLLTDKLKSIEAVKILRAEKIENGYDVPLFDIHPDWLRRAFAEKKIKFDYSQHLDYVSFSIDNEYGQPMIFYPGDWIIHDKNGKVYGVEGEIVKILNGEL